MRSLTPLLHCDGDEGLCDEWAVDYYAEGLTSVDGKPITTLRRSPGWVTVVSERDGEHDFCPRHNGGHTEEPAPTPKPDGLPDPLPEPYVWRTVNKREWPAAGRYRHILAKKGRDTSLCSTTALPASLWRASQGDRDDCPDCVARLKKVLT